MFWPMSVMLIRSYAPAIGAFAWRNNPNDAPASKNSRLRRRVAPRRLQHVHEAGCLPSYPPYSKLSVASGAVVAEAAMGHTHDCCSILRKRDLVLRGRLPRQPNAVVLQDVLAKSPDD